MWRRSGKKLDAPQIFQPSLPESSSRIIAQNRVFGRRKRRIANSSPSRHAQPMPNDKPRRPPSIATRTGDTGETSLLYGARVSKTHPQVEACGTVDELNAALGMAKATTDNAGRRDLLTSVQEDLIALMGEIAVPSADLERYEESGFPKIDEIHLKRLDLAVEESESKAERFEGWALPGANLHAASLDLARATTRRAERRLVSMEEHGVAIRPLLRKYLNRLSDLLWLLAREAEKEKS